MTGNSADLRTFSRYVSLNMVGMIGISCYILADTFFVARGLGATGLAALNIVIPIFNLMNGLGLMIGVGAASHYTINRAQNDTEAANRYFTHAIVLGTVVGILLFVFGIFFSSPVSWMLGADVDTFPKASLYLRTILIFAPFFVLNNVLLAFVRNDNAPNRAMCGMLIGSFCNIIFDYIFIFPLDLGMFGAAFATGASPIISILVLSGHLRKSSRGFHMQRTRLKACIFTSLCAPGTSAFISEFSSALVLLFFNLVLLHIAGTIGIAAYGVIANIALVAIAIFQGLATGIQPLVSRSCGANDTAALGKLYRYGNITALIIASLIYVFIFTFASPITAAFNSENNATLASYAVPGLRIYFIGFLFAGCNIVSSIFFSSSGKPGQGFLLSILRGVIFIVPMLFLLTTSFGITGAWSTFPCAEALTFAFTVFFAVRTFRRTQQ